MGPPATDDEDGSADQKNKCDTDDYACYCATRETTGWFGGFVSDSDVGGCVVYGEYRNQFLLGIFDKSGLREGEVRAFEIDY